MTRSVRVREAELQFRVAIPARYASTRLPGKPLRLLAGRPLIEHVYRRAPARPASRVMRAISAMSCGVATSLRAPRSPMT